MEVQEGEKFYRIYLSSRNHDMLQAIRHKDFELLGLVAKIDNYSNSIYYKKDQNEVWSTDADEEMLKSFNLERSYDKETLEAQALTILSELEVQSK